jgi:hypothetical protein
VTSNERKSTYHPEQEETQQIPTCYTRTRGEVIRNVVVPISKDTAHKHRCDTPSIVCLRCEIDDCNYSSYENVQTRPPNACSCADVDREAKEVFDNAAAVQHNQDGEDS